MPHIPSAASRMRSSKRIISSPLVFTKLLCDVLDDSRSTASCTKAWQTAKADWNQSKGKKKAMVRFYMLLPGGSDVKSHIKTRC